MDYLDFEYSELFEYASWRVHDFHSFYERCSSLALNLPYDADGSLSFEDWLAISIGELVWFSLPDLIKNLRPTSRDISKPTANCMECTNATSRLPN
jgi:hypothetical protein